MAILLILRFAGSRRSEAVQVRFQDIDRAKQSLYLRTKGHGEERLPVLLVPKLNQLLWLYATSFRPVPSADAQENLPWVFLSHSVRNYGQPLSDQSVGALLNSLRTVLDTPWNERLTPHMLRHSFGNDLQKLAGEAAVVAGMRHASIRSIAPYQAGLDVFAPVLLGPTAAKLEDYLAQAGLQKLVHV